MSIMPRSLFHERRWLALLCILVTAGTGGLLLRLTSTWCDALGHYDGLSMSELKSFVFWNIGFAPFTLLFGAWCYRKLRVRWMFLGTAKGTVFYFVFLTLLAFPFQFGGLVLRGDERMIDETICAKSTSNGMFTESKGLTVEEYEHLRALNPYLPPVPAGADSLRVEFYSDGFLPDFSLHVVCAVKRNALGEYPAYVQPMKDGPIGWMLDTVRTDPTVAWLLYEDGES